METLIHSFDFKVGHLDIDFTEQITFSALGNCILEAAGIAAHSNGFGMEELHEEHLGWVVSRMAIEMDVLPMKNDHFRIETWVENYGRFYTTRDFRFYNAENVCIGGVCSLWSVINLDTRVPFNLEQKPEWSRFATQIPSPITKPEHIPEISKEKIMHGCVSYSDIDSNGHVNSMKYIQWLLNLFDQDFYSTHRITRLEINYVHEALYGDKIVIFSSEDDKRILFNIKDEKGEIYCKMAVTCCQI
ncbi:MAG: hypothetical protein LBS16_07560 [Prevotellaceae bacterium]|nr:hypothetical protein [Prevotellaceae bacterium]